MKPMMVMGTLISEGNSKLGKIASISLHPGDGCRHDCNCRIEGCYAVKIARIYNSCRHTWAVNLKVADGDPNKYFRSISGYLDYRKPNVFRWHVSGDILNENYRKNMFAIARKHPDVRFLCFTKMYDLINKVQKRYFPPNLRIVFSAWPGYPMENRHNLPVAYMKDKNNPDPRIPKDAILCRKQCDECMLCWDLPEGASVYFKKH